VISRDQGQQPSSISGKERIAIVSKSANALDWSYKPKKESKTLHNIIIDARVINVPQFTVEIWAVEPKRNNVRAVLSTLKKHNTLICDHINWTTPEFIIVVWTVTGEEWERFRNTLSSLPPG